ncbi:MAG TPA: hypothetical protein ENJ90_06560 [Devosia sp.]|nr:hypothetical protein [Devosia sp.]
MHLVVVGAQKSGTTWLYSMLRQHRQTGFSYLKEVHYFDRVHDRSTDSALRLSRLRRRLSNPGGLRERLSYPLRHLSADYRKYYDYVLNPENAYTDEWYEATFSKKPENIRKAKKVGNLVYCDLTPAYMAMPEQGYAHMATLLPGLTPILIVRDPLRRAVSALNMLHSRKLPSRKAGDSEISPTLGERQILRGDYGRSIPLLKKHFSRLKIIPFGRIQADPAGVLAEIEKIHGLDPMRYSGIGKKRNSRSGRFRLSEAALAEVNKVCAPQYEFLRQEFGSDFLKEI